MNKKLNNAIKHAKISVKEKEQVTWKTYPEFPFIEANQFGEIRTKDRTVTRINGRKQFVKGRILKQQLTNRGYMQVLFKANGKLVHLSVHRVVATCFFPNQNGYPEVNHKDCDRTNNSVSNLEWCTQEYNNAYREKHGVSAKEYTIVLRKPVFAVDLNSFKVLQFESQHEAARQLGIDQGNINSVVKGKLKQIGGYWFTENRNEITEEKIREIKSNMRFLGNVIAINLSNFKVFYFKSQSEAARQLIIAMQHINGVVKGKRNTTGGFWFCCADENAVEKTRMKFGDKIAKKVEELMRGMI